MHEEEENFLQIIFLKKKNNLSRIYINKISIINDVPTWKKSKNFEQSKSTFLCFHYGNKEITFKLNNIFEKELLWQGIKYFATQNQRNQSR